MVPASVFVFAALSLAAQPAQAPPSPCSQAIATPDAAAAEVCAGDEASRRAAALPKDSRDRTNQFEAAAHHYRRAANLSSGDAKIRALNLLADSYDAVHLNAPEQMEGVLRELIQLVPTDLGSVFRLAKLQDERGFIDAAEDILLNAKRQQPDVMEPYQMLVQFYARRVTAMHKPEADPRGPKVTSAPGEQDADGVFRVGGAIAPPSRLDVPKYPADAQASGLKGVVIAEIVIDEFGSVSDAKIVRSIPLLDDAALQAVRNWRYAPTLVNGQPVPVRTNVTVNFTLPPAAREPPRR